MMLPGEAARRSEDQQRPVARPHPWPAFVFVQHGQRSTAGEPISDGPYKVKNWFDKYYELDIQ
jgi:hypothetical protein